MRYLDPTISNYSKAISSGLDAQRQYQRAFRFDQHHGERAERLACIAMIRANLPEDEWPEFAREAATAPAAEAVARPMTRKRQRAAEARYQREVQVQEVRCDLGRLVEAWGATVRDGATLRALRGGR